MQTQGVVPILSYENGVVAIEWLAKAFGFQETMRLLDENNERLTHGEMETGNGIIMLATPTPDYESPKKHLAHCEQAMAFLHAVTGQKIWKGIAGCLWRRRNETNT